MQFTGLIADVVRVTSRGQTVEIDVTKLSSEIIAQAVVHGLTQKVADAAANAKKLAEESDSTAEEIAVELMSKVRDALYAGDWRRSADSVDDFTRVARQMVRAAIKAQVGAKSPEWKAFEGLSDDAQNAKLDANIDANFAAIEPMVREEIERRKAKPKLNVSISI